MVVLTDFHVYLYIYTVLTIIELILYFDYFKKVSVNGVCHLEYVAIKEVKMLMLHGSCYHILREALAEDL
jgi:hypothetical protein